MAADRTVAERRFRAMGSDAHVVVVGGPGDLALAAERRIEELERLWSRFDPRSEVSAITRHAGSPVVVSPETRELVERAITAWRITNGIFDPTVLGALVRAGYDRTFDELASAPRMPEVTVRTGPGLPAPGADAIDIIADTVRIPRGSGFDPGGIGKGLAADIVADELRTAGAAGVCINLGGDVRVEGAAPSGDAWTVAVDHPWTADPIARAGLARGAVATSTTLKRQWHVDGELRHHLIDPATGRPSTSDLTFVTVVAGHAWMAEVLAKATLLHGTPLPWDLVTNAGGAALAIDRAGTVFASPGTDAYLAEPLPAVIAFDGADLNVRAS